MADLSPHFDPADSYVLREWEWSPPEEPRFRVRSHYVERLWLPLLGPTALLLVRLLAELIDESHNGQGVDFGLVAVALGVGLKTPGEQSALARALGRLERFELVRFDGRGEIMVRVELPLVSPRDLSGLPLWLQERHAHATES